MNASTSVWSALVDIIIRPGRAIVAQDQHKGWLWLPLLLLIGSMIALWGYYFTWVDYEWYLVDYLNNVELEEAQRDATAQMMSPTFSITLTSVMVTLFTLIMFLIYALYLNLVARSSGEEVRGFGHWFSLSVWTAFPGILGVIALFVFLATSPTNQVSQFDMDFMSLNGVLDLEPKHPFATLASAISIFHVWSILLVGYAWRLLRESTMINGIMVAAIPYVVIFGIWALFTAI